MRTDCCGAPGCWSISHTCSTWLHRLCVRIVLHRTGDHRHRCLSRKIVGSAQMRTRDGFLQHGSVVLKNDLEKLFAVVRTSQPNVHDAARRAARLMTSVSDEAHRVVTFGEMTDALVAAFSAAKGVRLLADSLTQREIANAAGIVARKYGREDWNALR